MRFNSDADIARARRDIRRYGSLSNLMAATTRREDGVRVLPPEGSKEEAEAMARVSAQRPPPFYGSVRRR